MISYLLPSSGSECSSSSVQRLVASTTAMRPPSPSCSTIRTRAEDSGRTGIIGTVFMQGCANLLAERTLGGTAESRLRAERRLSPRPGGQLLRQPFAGARGDAGGEVDDGVHAASGVRDVG